MTSLVMEEYTELFY